MNPAIYPTQSNTKLSPLVIALAAVALVGMEGRLVKLTHTAGVPQFALPTNIADDADYVLLEGGEIGEPCTAAQLSPERNLRVRLNGTANPGDKLCLAAIAGVDAGKVRTIPVAAGAYIATLVAEEVGVDEQLLLVRPLNHVRSITVV